MKPTWNPASFVIAGIALMHTASETVQRLTVTSNSPQEALTRIADDAEFAAAWEKAPEFCRRDLLTLATRTAIEVDITDFYLRDIYSADLIKLIHPVALMGLARIERERDPSAEIIAPNPLTVSNTPTNRYAMFVVCDASEPERDKRFAFALLFMAALLKRG